jgi:hypothetical protein
MKLLITTLITLFISVSVFGQDNDSSLLRKHHVSEVKKKLYVHAFASKKDSCVMNFRKFSESGKILYEKTDMMCMGWPSYEEVFFEYKDSKISKVEIHRDGKQFNKATYEYDEIGTSPTVVKTFFYQTNDSSLLRNQFFYNDSNKLDSTIANTIKQDGTVEQSITIARYNDQGEVVQLFTLNEEGRPTEMVTYEIGDNGLALSVAFTTYGEKPIFTQVFYTYNQDGRVSSSYNTVNQKQEYFYLDNGLINNILNYNPKGELEAEYIFEYTYK